MDANHPFTHRPPLWVYHDLGHAEWRRPEYQNLCVESAHRHCGRRFRVIELNRYNIYTYVPDLDRDVWIHCTPAQRVDLMRWELLSRYGGLWLDVNVMVLADLSPFMAPLRTHDAVLFGDGGTVEGGVGGVGAARVGEALSATTRRPHTWALASRPGGELVTAARARCWWTIRNQPERLLLPSAHDAFGPMLLWATMARLRDSVTPSHEWRYYHTNASHCWDEPTEALMEPDEERTFRAEMCMVPLRETNGSGCGLPAWVQRAGREELLGAGCVLGALYRWSLG